MNSSVLDANIRFDLCDDDPKVVSAAVAALKKLPFDSNTFNLLRELVIDLSLDIQDSNSKLQELATVLNLGIKSSPLPPENETGQDDDNSDHEVIDNESNSATKSLEPVTFGIVVDKVRLLMKEADLSNQMLVGTSSIYNCRRKPTLPIDRPVIGKDLQTWREQHRLNTSDACFVFALSTNKWGVLAKSSNPIPPEMELMVRLYDEFPALIPVPRTVHPRDFMDSLGISVNEYGPALGREVTAGTRWEKYFLGRPHGQKPTPVPVRLGLAAYNLSEVSPDLRKHYYDVIKQVAELRQLRNPIETGTWKDLTQKYSDKLTHLRSNYPRRRKKDVNSELVVNLADTWLKGLERKAAINGQLESLTAVVARLKKRAEKSPEKFQASLNDNSTKLDDLTSELSQINQSMDDCISELKKLNVL